MKSFLSAFAETFSPGRSIRVIALLCLVGLFASYAFAQEATIVGTVTDPTGAAVPNAAITITSLETGIASNFTTNDVGQYVAAGLRIGRYSLRLTASGFKTVEQKDIVLSVGDRARLDFQLQVGGTSETVSVETTPIAVQTDTSEISDVITSRQVTQLATNGRSIYTLVNLTPGASSLQGDFQTPTPVGGDASVSFNGNRPGHNLYIMDGGENLDRGGAGTFSVMPSMDAIAEFRVLSSNYSAEYGLSSAATMTTILKSGTNKYKATLWEFVRNDIFDANSFFNNHHPVPVKKAKLRYNTYGFNVGGPVDFWKDDHKTFFFYNMEWRKLIQGGSFNPKVPPTSAYPTASGAVIPTSITSQHGPINVPLATDVSATTLFARCPGGVAPAGIVQGSAFPNNTIPACMISPNASALLAAGIFPANNGVNDNGVPTFTGGGDSPTNVREEIVRMDHNFSDKFSIFGHFVAEQILQTFGTTMWSGDNVPTIGNTFGNPSYSGVVHTIHTISPTLINETAFNYNGNRIAILPKGLVSAPAGFTFNRIFTGPNDNNRIPIINLGGDLGTQYSANWTPWNNKADSYQLRDDISWTKGAHQMKFGASWALYKKVQDIFASTQGNFGFDGHFTQAGQVNNPTDKKAVAGSDFADFLLGLSNNYQENGLKDAGNWNAVSWAAYFQDNWRVNNKLTVNLGLRWDGVPHTYEAKHRTTNFYPELYQPDTALLPDGSVNPASPFIGTSPNPILGDFKFYLNGIGFDGLGGIPKGLVDNHWAAFGPRIGFAFDPSGNGKTVLRGGFGVMYERIQGNDMYNMGANAPFSAGISYNSVTLDNPHTSVLGVTQTPSIPIVGLTGISRKDYKLPVSYQYSFSVQRSLNEKSVLSVSYVGNQNRHQNYWQEINLPDPSVLAELTTRGKVGPTDLVKNQLVPFQGYDGIRLAVNGGNGSYNSLQTELKSTIRRDLQLQVGYTLSHAEDFSTGNGNGYDLNNISNPYAGWRYDMGNSFFDRTHVAFVNFVYDLPIFRSSDNKFLKNGLGGWQVSSIISAMTGAPLNITYNGHSVTSEVRNAINRPNLTGDVSYPQTVDHWFTGNFTAPADGQWGNLKHGAVRGPGRDNWNMALFKNFNINAERGTRLEFRAEFFNIWNHTQFRGDAQGGGISVNAAASDFGQIQGAYNPRNLQFGLKLYF